MLNWIDPTRMQSLFDNLPEGLMLADASGKIVWVNQSLLTMTGAHRADLEGKKSSQISAALQPLFNSDRLILEQNGTKTTLAIMKIGLGEHSLYYVSDMSLIASLQAERVVLQEKVAELTPHDPVTGLLNRRAILTNLEQQSSRSRRYGNMLSVMILRLANLQDYRNKFGDAKADALLLSISQTLNDQMRWADVIGRYEENEYMLILPETQEQVARELRSKIHEYLKMLPQAKDGFNLQFDFGMVQWRKGDDVAMLLKRVHSDLDTDPNQRIAV